MLKRRDAVVVDLSQSTKAVIEKKGTVTFVRGRYAWVLTDSEARRLHNVYDEPREGVTDG